MVKTKVELLEDWTGALVGKALDAVPTPALIINLDAMSRNICKMAGYARRAGVRLRVHSKTHKSVDIALRQIEAGACGICCQKVSEAEVMVEGGIKDILISNQVVSVGKIEKLAALAGQARIIVCVDDAENVEALSRAAGSAGTVIECLVEIDVGSGRCGVAPGEPALELARKIAASNGLRFSGLQAYHGAAQHVRQFDARASMIERAVTLTSKTMELLHLNGLACEIVGGAGTGTFEFEAASGVYNELQCGSYVFMDADYEKNLGQGGNFIDVFENSLFVLSEVMSKPRTGVAICDAGLKAYSVDSGLPYVYRRPGILVTKCSDEHTTLTEAGNTLRIGDKLLLVPGHCDPTCNLYDNYVVVSEGHVSDIWPVSARGLLF